MTAQRLKLFLVELMLAGMVTGVQSSCAAPAPAEGPQVGMTAPDFTAKNLITGESVELNSLRGKLVIVTFWATWCGQCRRELPMLEAAQKLVGKERLAVLAVNLGESYEVQAQIRRLMKQCEISLMADSHSRIAEAYKVKGIPNLFMIDRDGKIIANHLGYGDRSIEELVADINAALQAPETTTPPER